MKEKEYEVIKNFGDFEVGDIVIQTGAVTGEGQYHTIKLVNNKDRDESYYIEDIKNIEKDKYLKAIL